MPRLLLLLLALLPCFLHASQNPFSGFAKRPYAQYHYALRDTLRHIYAFEAEDGIEMRKAVKQMQSLPDTYQDGQWQLEAEFFQINYQFDYMHTSASKFRVQLHHMLEECRNKGNQVFELRLLRRLYDFELTEGNEDWMRYAYLMEKLMDEIPSKDFPDMMDYRYTLAAKYMNLKDYPRAEKIFKEVLSYPFQPDNPRPFFHSRNSLGIIARETHHDLKQSDQWFNSILPFFKSYHITDVKQADWVAIVSGNLGKNEMSRKHYTRAIELMESAYNYMMSTARDYHYAFNKAVDITECYVSMAQYTNAKDWLSRADAAEQKYRENENGNEDHDRILLAKSKYFSGIGDAHHSSLYLDSALQVKRKWEATNHLSRLNEITREMDNAQIEQYSFQNVIHRHWLMLLTIFCAILVVGVTILVIAYHKKHEKYRELTAQAKEWSGHNVALLQTPMTASAPDDKDEALARVKKHLESTKCYCNSDLTIEKLARDLGMSRTTLSTIINRTGAHFNHVINTYRIKDAVKMLVERPKLSMSEIMYHVGFNNRRSFNTAFKKITGMTPSAFRQNLQIVDE